MADRVERPWGWFESLGSGEGYQVKRLCINAGQRISLQRHRHRLEHWVVVSGDGELECDGERHPAAPGTTLLVPCGAVHRASAGRSGGRCSAKTTSNGWRTITPAPPRLRAWGNPPSGKFRFHPLCRARQFFRREGTARSDQQLRLNPKALPSIARLRHHPRSHGFCGVAIGCLPACRRRTFQAQTFQL
jgi:mannose-6-phosphate isomerase-like protein (cupin superfamily)